MPDRTPTPTDTARRRPPGAPAAGDRPVPLQVGTLSPWALRQVVDLGERIPSLGCDTRRQALERLIQESPDDADLLEKRLDQVLAGGGGAPSIRAATDLARARSFDQWGVLRALEVLAPLATDSPEARAALVALLGRLSRVPTGGPDPVHSTPFPVRPRRSMAPYCAARAALAGGPRAAERWWRRAVEIDPLRAPYRRRLADCLEAIGDRDAAALQRRAAEDLEEVPECAS